MRSVSVFRVVLLVCCKKLTMFSILSNEHMDLGGNIRFDYFTDVFKIHFGAICYSAITAVNSMLLLTFMTRMGPFHVKWYAKLR